MGDALGTGDGTGDTLGTIDALGTGDGTGRFSISKSDTSIPSFP
ncbi:hypothetical protein PBCVCvsA1_560R [Paramecium bursaria Chlorella virus CvsA1]|nr:hypothetical protein PBCVCviKI_543R [Paramecium bursaria Chlorella virus CviKI]AGE52620.1 hypothetical protein PBCVCvsA1_560R [Paramecium bursaria Chlorella virus CvsA1]